MTGKNSGGLIDLPLGKEAADVFIHNARVLCVYTGRVLSGYNVVIKGKHIGYVGPSTAMTGPDTQIIDGQDQILVPGYIDAHAHGDYITSPPALARAVVPRGTTGLLSDTHDLCGALGARGMELMLELTEGLPLKFYLCLPVTNPALPEIEGGDILSAGEFQYYLNHPRVVSASELVGWKRVIDGDPVVLIKLAAIRAAGKRVEGHAAGCSLEKLSALINAGVTSCHESISPRDVEQRLTAGLYTMVRHGSIRQELPALAGLLAEDWAERGRLLLTPDWMSPGDIMENGYMDFIIKEAIGRGVPPVRAIRMAAINPATYLGLDNLVGGIAPGRLADINFLESLENPVPVRVMVEGKMAAENGKLLTDIPGRCPAFTTADWRPGRVPAFRPRAEHFRVPAPEPGAARQTVPAMRFAGGTLTRLEEVTLPVQDGLLVPEGDVLKISMLHLDGRKFVTAFLTGFGARIGGLALSVAHDHHMPMVLGCRDEDMAVAVNRMLELGGGLVAVQDGRVTAECALPVGGIMSPREVPELAGELAAVEDYLRAAGCRSDRPFVTLAFLSFVGIPYARITPRGLYDVRQGKIVFPARD
ncbi:adenine deaminase C-terminal domain-containing protein [Desulfotomaculum copahuensis]|uniref:Adenine deaminase n=1 Tax=Desulfotomaculum copahuensis TaxID=1838280 RepID=A0A1B7LGP7_9FIRM|nr:adenine deaminase C-terminal domain-containing protein [Desulfotomaculum copahuensis]OAT85282.1 hypothetical protein A6M21_07010 [Desulfotomaculum copahuensis]